MNTSDNQKWTLNEVLTNFTKRQAQIAQERQMKDELKQLMLNQQAQQLSQFVPGAAPQPQEETLDDSYNAFKQGGIQIDPSKKGTFKAQATRMGMSVQQAAKHILANKEKYSSGMVKKANFARNFAKEEGGQMNDDPCPEGYYWNEYTRECIPFGENVPSQQQVFDPYNPMNEVYQDFLNKLERKRNVMEYELYRQQKLNEIYEKNYKGPWIIDEETGEKIRIDKSSEEYQKFKENEDFKNFKNQYPSKDSPGFDIPKDFEQKQYYPKDGVWDEKSKQLFNNFFEYDDEDLKNFQNYFDKTYPGEHRKASPKDIYEDNYDNWCPCYKTQQIFVQGLPVTQKVCVPCEQAKYGGVFYNEGGEMIKRADGSYSRRGLWDNIRANRGSGKKPTKEMLAQERKIKKKANGGMIPSYGIGGENDGCPEGHIWIESQQACVPVDSLSNYLAEPEKYTTSSLERFVNNEIEIEKKLQELELAKQQYPELEAQYTAAQQALLKEQKRVEAVRSRVIPASYELDKADDYLNKVVYGDKKSLSAEQRAMQKKYENYTNAETPQSLQDATRALPQELKNVLPNQGRYNVARWNSKQGDWAEGSTPSRELYCTPYGCFAYQKAGATDVPIIGGNMAFASMSKSGQLPFEKINPSQRRPGDMGLLVSNAPASYTDHNSPTVLRPHHTMIYAEPGNNPSNPEEGKFYNAQDGNRLFFDKTYVTTQRKYNQPEDRIDYYRYVGKTRELETSLKDLENRKLAEADRLKNMESSIPMSYLPMIKPKFIDQERAPMELQNTVPPTVTPPSMRERIGSTLSRFIPTRFDNGGETQCPEGQTWNEQLQACVPSDQNEAQAFLTNWYQNRMNLFNNPQAGTLEESEDYKAWMSKILPTIQQRSGAYPAPEYRSMIEGDPSVMGMYESGKNPKVILKESLNQNPREKTITETHEYSTFLTDPMQKFVYPVHNRVIQDNFKSYDEVVKGKSKSEAEDIGAFYDYVTDPQQDNVHSYLMNARRIFNVKPDQVVTEEDVNKWLEKANNEGMLDKNNPNYNDELYILFNMSKGKKGLTNLFNYMVKNESPSDKSLNMAKYGGNLGNVPNFF